MHKVGSKENPFHVAIIGSGPSGFYATEALLASEMAVKISMIEKLPVPFGLVRYGVAPDHQKLKQVSVVFDQLARHPDFSFYGNLEVGDAVSVSDLLDTHHAVIVCSGASSDRRLGIPGENLPGSHAATEFVAWYNGHPAYSDRTFDLSCDEAVIIGQGNVAIDVCRILAKPVDELRRTDIATHAIEQLAESKVRRIHVVGRRGIAQVKFTSKELREIGQIEGVKAKLSDPDLSLTSEDLEELADPKNVNVARCVEIIRAFPPVAAGEIKKEILFHFMLSPTEIRGDARLEHITFARNRLVGKAFSRSIEPTGGSTDISCGLCFRSIGYFGRPLPDIPFDSKKGIVPNSMGRVTDVNGAAVSPLYVSGWIKRGPSGTIGTNRADSLETVSAILEDVPDLIRRTPGKLGALKNLLASRGHYKVINFDQWLEIDSEERRTGEKRGKIREKFTAIDSMLEAVSRDKVLSD